MKIKREVTIGLLLAGTIFLFIWGVNYLKGTGIFSKQISFYAIYEKTGGLIETNPVSISGLKIGHVDKIFFHPDGSGNLIVKCIIDHKIDIPDNSTARIFGAGITGSREIDIALGNSPKNIESGDTLSSILEPTIQEEISQHLAPLKDKAENVLIKADSVLTGFNNLLTHDTRKNVTESIEDLRKSLASMQQLTYNIDTTFTNQSGKFKTIIDNVESVSTNLKKSNNSITYILENIESITDTLVAADIKQTINNANQSLENFDRVMQKIDQGKGSAGLLINNDTLYYNLARSSHELELLLDDIRNNPKKYFNISVFGN